MEEDLFYQKNYWLNFAKNANKDIDSLYVETIDVGA